MAGWTIGVGVGDGEGDGDGVTEGAGVAVGDALAPVEPADGSAAWNPGAVLPAGVGS